MKNTFSIFYINIKKKLEIENQTIEERLTLNWVIILLLFKVSYFEAYS